MKMIKEKPSITMAISYIFEQIDSSLSKNQTFISFCCNNLLPFIIMTLKESLVNRDLSLRIV